MIYTVSCRRSCFILIPLSFRVCWRSGWLVTPSVPRRHAELGSREPHTGPRSGRARVLPEAGVTVPLATVSYIITGIAFDAEESPSHA